MLDDRAIFLIPKNVIVIFEKNIDLLMGIYYNIYVNIKIKK